jgi:hypothetical protein
MTYGNSGKYAANWDLSGWAKNRAFTPYESIMCAPPGIEPGVSQMEIIHLRDIINDVMEDILTPMELWVFNAVVVERQSLRQLGRQINRPKTTIARIRDGALKKLREALQDNPAIMQYLETQ